MVAIGVVVIVTILIVGIGIPLMLRKWTFNEAKTEAHLRSPETHTVVHTVSAGVDPVFETAALRSAGYESMVDLEGGFERVIVECDEDEREAVRDIIEHAASPQSGELEQRLDHVDFADEASSP